jgi:hypothetical protein
LICGLMALMLSFCNPGIAMAGDDQARPEVIASWVQYTADGVEVRAVTRGTCPELVFDGKRSAMSQRAAPTDRHPNRVCTAQIPDGTTAIQLNGKPLPAPMTATPKRVSILGDTGCRVSDKHGLYQACNNSSIWPFPTVADSVARFAPDLIVYAGDYIYRESACPVGNNGCEGTPWGDSQATWDADFFQPSRALRAAAPVVFLRGNHENCARAGQGWFRYLDARPYSGDCAHSTDPWLAQIGTLRLVALDTSELEDTDKEPLTGLFAKQLRLVGELLDGPGWLVTHRPFWGFGADDDTGKAVTPTAVLQDAVREAGLPAEVSLLIGSHIHLAEVIDFGERRPPQLVVGNSGTQLVPVTPPPVQIDDVPVASQRVVYEYGFVTMERLSGNDWTITFRDRDGRDIEGCRFDGTNVTCPGHSD